MLFYFTFPRRNSNGARSLRTVFVAGLAIAAASLAACEVAAQTLPAGITPDQLQQLQQLQQMQQTQSGSSSAGAAGNAQSLAPRDTIIEPASPPNTNLPTTRIEEIMSQRAGTKLRLIGYEQLGVGRAVSLPQVGGIQDSYILGPGDEIVVSLRGQENAEYRATVDRDGRIVLPRLNPVSAAGRTFGDFRQDLVNAIHRAYVSTEGFVSVGRLRQISVLVSGEVGSPGMRTLTGLSTVVDAVLVSGGIKKSGSLRNVQIIRGGRVISVDLYSVLTGQARASSAALTNGDRIVVPALGRTVAVVGWVRRPGIYELAGGRSAISTRDLIALSGGLEVRGKYLMSLMRVAADGRNQMVPLVSGAGTVSDSEILFVHPSASETSQTATLSGGTHLAGQYSSNTKLSDIIKSPGALGTDPYTLFGIVSRRDPVTLLRTLIPITPVAVLKGSEDLRIQSDDVVRVISTSEARSLLSAIEQYRARQSADQDSLINPRGKPTTGVAAVTTIGSATALGSVLGGSTGTAGGTANAADTPELAQRRALATANTSGTNLIGLEGGQGRSTLQSDIQPLAGPALNAETNRISDMALQLRVDPLVLMNFLDDRALSVDGAVQGPGLYLVGPDADISSVIAAAGGYTRWADKSAVEVTSTVVDASSGKARTDRRMLSLASNADAAYIVSPQDEVRVNQVFTDVGVGTVIVQGQVRHGGTYHIVRGEHLSDVLMRAGGLTETAYPYGTIFLRKTAAQHEQDAFQRQAQEIENQLLLAMSRRDPNSKLSPDAFQALQGYVAQVRNQKPLGRVGVTADPVVLASNPAADPLLEAGDVVFIPSRPFSVSVLGEVLQPGSIPFDRSASAQDYIDGAGGYSQFADKSETILVLPDGSARRVDRSWFNFNSDTIPPGSTIFVARDVSGVDIHQIITESTAIISQLAVTAASLAVLSKQ